MARISATAQCRQAKLSAFCDFFQFLRFNDLTVQSRLLGSAPVCNSHQLAVVGNWHVKVGFVGLVDLFLIDFNVHLTNRTGCDDHVCAMVISRFYNVLDLLLTFFPAQRMLMHHHSRLPSGRTLSIGSPPTVFHHLVEIHRIFVRFSIDAKRPVGLAAHISGEFYSVQGFHDWLGHSFITNIFNQCFDHVTNRHFVLEIKNPVRFP